MAIISLKLDKRVPNSEKVVYDDERRICTYGTYTATIDGEGTRAQTLVLEPRFKNSWPQNLFQAGAPTITTGRYPIQTVLQLHSSTDADDSSRTYIPFIEKRDESFDGEHLLAEYPQGYYLVSGILVKDRSFEDSASSVFSSVFTPLAKIGIRAWDHEYNRTNKVFYTEYDDAKNYDDVLGLVYSVKKTNKDDIWLTTDYNEDTKEYTSTKYDSYTLTVPSGYDGTPADNVFEMPLIGDSPDNTTVYIGVSNGYGLYRKAEKMYRLDSSDGVKWPDKNATDGHYKEGDVWLGINIFKDFYLFSNNNRNLDDVVFFRKLGYAMIYDISKYANKINPYYYKLAEGEEGWSTKLIKDEDRCTLKGFKRTGSYWGIKIKRSSLFSGSCEFYSRGNLEKALIPIRTIRDIRDSDDNKWLDCEYNVVIERVYKIHVGGASIVMDENGRKVEAYSGGGLPACVCAKRSEKSEVTRYTFAGRLVISYNGKYVVTSKNYKRLKIKQKYIDSHEDTYTVGLGGNDYDAANPAMCKLRTFEIIKKNDDRGWMYDTYTFRYTDKDADEEDVEKDENDMYMEYLGTYFVLEYPHKAKERELKIGREINKHPSLTSYFPCGPDISLLPQESVVIETDANDQDSKDTKGVELGLWFC